MDIPYKDLSTSALNNIIEEFVSREGTDYGNYNYSLADKVDHVIKQLKSGQAIIVFDAESETIHIQAVE